LNLGVYVRNGTNLIILFHFKIFFSLSFEGTVGKLKVANSVTSAVERLLV